MNLRLLTAHYLTDHAYLEYPGQVLNFGGRHLYRLVSSSDKEIVFAREPNPTFQAGFFDIAGSRKKLGNVSAIVGQNGVGKSTILNSIRQHFVESPTALPWCASIMLFEDDDKVLYSSNRESLRVRLQEESGTKTLRGIRTGTIQSIYYSPHFDLRFNPNFDEIDYHDISLDRYVELDLMDLDRRGTNDHGVDYPVKQELLFKNSRRQIRFLNSALVTKKKLFDGLIDFPDHGKARFISRATKFDDDLRNIPASYLGPLKELRDQIERDLDGYTSVRRTDEKHQIINQLEIDRFLLQRHMVRDLLSVLIRQMDVSNQYRSDNSFDGEHFKTTRGNDSLSGLIAFLESSRIPTPKGEMPPFDTALITRLFEKLNALTDAITVEGDLSQSSFLVPAEDAIALLELQNEVVYNISGYYTQQWSEKPRNLERINYLVPAFLYYSPANRQLSSGENALLNFFSKLHDFLVDKRNPDINPPTGVYSFVLLLDEADLGFHPVWKKKYLYILVKTLPHFFEPYKDLKHIELVFTTHDPLTLSDLPNNNVSYLLKESSGIRVLDPKERRPTFAANITDLLADSFFIDDALIGDFAQLKIRGVIEWLNSADTANAAIHRQVIEIIDEPVVRQKLAEMYDRKMNTDVELALIDKQLQELNERKNKLQHDRD